MFLSNGQNNMKSCFKFLMTKTVAKLGTTLATQNPYYLFLIYAIRLALIADVFQSKKF